MIKRLRRKYKHHKNHHKSHKARHKKHFSKKWGFIFLAVLILGLTVVIPRLSENQNLFSGAYLDPGSSLNTNNSRGKSCTVKSGYDAGKKGTCYDTNSDQELCETRYTGLGGHFNPNSNCQPSNSNIQCCVKTEIKKPSPLYPCTTKGRSTGYCVNTTSNGSAGGGGTFYEQCRDRFGTDKGLFLDTRSSVRGCTNEQACCVTAIGTTDACKRLKGTCEKVIPGKNGGSYHKNLCEGPYNYKCWVPK